MTNFSDYKLHLSNFSNLLNSQVIDSSDSLRMIVIKEELELLLKHDQLASNPFLPILFCANKMDLKDAMSSMKIVEHLGLNQIGERPWHIQVGDVLSMSIPSMGSRLWS